MGRWYELAYKVGFTPWERAGQDDVRFVAMLEEETARHGAPPGRALDLGCGSGAHSVELARLGWEVTGVDSVERALARARERGGAEGVRFIAADVTALEGAIEPGVDFFLDVGCFHGLDDAGRRGYGAGVRALAAPGATMLVLSFVPGRRLAMPRGATADDLLSVLPGWEVAATEAASTDRMPPPLRRLAPQFFRLRSA